MSAVPGKYLVTIRHGGYHHIRPTHFDSEGEAKTYKEFLQKQLTAEYDSRKGRSKGAKPFVYVWKLLE